MQNENPSSSVNMNQSESEGMLDESKMEINSINNNLNHNNGGDLKESIAEDKPSCCFNEQKT